MMKSIRGAITVDNNSIDAIKNAVLELFSEIVTRNDLSERDTVFVEFSATKDLNAVYPAKFIRQELGWNDTAFMCVQEMDVINSLPMCIRVLVVCNKSEDFKPEFVYLRGAKNLRS